MRIYTSSWFTRLPPAIQRIGISRGTPRGQPAGYRMMRELAPGSWFRTVSAVQYTKLYMELLSELNPQSVVDRMAALSEGRDVALLCFESPHKPNDWCHRGHVSAWLMEECRLQVFEFGLEREGCGWHHPKLPAQLRKQPDPTPIDVEPFLNRTAVDAQGVKWRVIGRDPDLPNQALIERVDEPKDIRSVSQETLEQRFGEAPTLGI